MSIEAWLVEPAKKGLFRPPRLFISKEWNNFKTVQPKTAKISHFFLKFNWEHFKVVVSCSSVMTAMFSKKIIAELHVEPHS